jgi:hypothetical protein
MGKRHRHRIQVDAQRLGEAVKRPGIDPRTWVTQGRIEDDTEATSFDADVGWIVDVSPGGSDLEGAGEMPCRVLSPSAGDGFGEYVPPPTGAEVTVVVAGGDPELGPVVVGFGSNGGGCKPPATVNGLAVSPDAAASTPALVAPADTEFKRSPHHRREEYALDRHIQARNQIIEAGELVKLAARDAAQSFVRGERFVQVLNAWIDAVSSFISANGAADAKIYTAVNALAPGTLTPQEILDVATAVVQVPLQKAAFQAAAVAGDALSERIKGD